MRRVAMMLAVFALLVGCDAVPGSIEEMADELESRIIEGAAEVEQNDAASADEGGSDGAADEAGGTAAGDGDGTDGDPGSGASGGDGGSQGDPGGGVEVNDAGPVGGNGLAILRADVPRLVVEVDVQEGLSPNSGALDHVRAVLARETDKPGGIALERRGFTSDRRQWSAADVRAIADQRRQRRSNADQAAIYVAYLRGSFERSSAIGVAVNASTIAVFPEQWSGAVETLVGSSAAVERAVLVHEIGHLLGLVELTYESRHDRHDDAHPGHSTNRGSVMHHAIATTAVGQVFAGPPPDDFDQMDRDDLRFLRTGSW